MVGIACCLAVAIAATGGTRLLHTRKPSRETACNTAVEAIGCSALLPVRVGSIDQMSYVGRAVAMSDHFEWVFAKRDAAVSHLSPFVCKQLSSGDFEIEIQ